MNQSQVKKWFRIFYHLAVLGTVLILILLTLALGVMLIDDLNLTSIIIIILVALLMIALFRRIH